MRYLIFSIALVPMLHAFAQQPGTLDTTFAGDGVFHFPADLELVDRRWSVQEIEPDRFLLIDESIGVGHVRVGLLAVVDTDTLLLEIGMWSLDLAPDHGASYADGKLTFYSTVDSECTISRYFIDGTPDVDFGFGGELTIVLQGAFSSDETFFRGCTESPNGEWYCWVDGFSAPNYSNGYLIKTDHAGVLDASFGLNGVKSFPAMFGFVEVRCLSNGNVLVWLNHGSTSPFTPGSHSVKILDENGALLHNYQSSCPGVPRDSQITSVLLYQEEVMLVTAGGPQCHSRFRISGLGSMAATFYYVSADSDFDDEYSYIKAFAVDVHGRSYYTGNPSGFNALNSPWIIARRNSDGTRDMEFGLIDHPFGSSGSIRGGLVECDGKLLVYGRAFGQPVLARYHNIPDPRSTLSLRMFLGGAYDANTALMRDNLRQQGLLPNLQPYGAAFFPPANGVGAWAMPQHLLAVEGEEAVVDWVFLELISAADSNTVAATRVGILHRNGWVTSADGHSPIDFSAGAASYFLRVRHRNHLGVTTSQPITLGPSTTTVDLTDPATATFGTDAQMDVNGVRMLWPGDATTDGAVKYFGPYNDRDKILVAIGGSVPTATITGYRAEDVNLDGVVKYTGLRNDRDIILQTIGGTVPTAVRVEQRP